MTRAKLNINIDGSGRAHNWDNSKGLIHLCNAARVYPVGWRELRRQRRRPTCTGKFMNDPPHVSRRRDGQMRRLEPSVGMDARNRHYGGARTHHRARGVTPVEIPDSGDSSSRPPRLATRHFHVGPAPLRRPAGRRERGYPLPGSLDAVWRCAGTLGVAYRAKTGRTVPSS